MAATMADMARHAQSEADIRLKEPLESLFGGRCGVAFALDPAREVGECAPA